MSPVMVEGGIIDWKQKEGNAFTGDGLLEAVRFKF
jgi:pyruvate/2-oxoglutarate dehydrogenase complex dihydrolipoamide acyltransferase (E2) component